MEAITRDEVLTRAASNHLTFLAFAFGYLKDWTAAEDVVQESYIMIGKKWQNYRPETSIIPWGRIIIRNKSLEYRKAKQKELAFSNDYIEEKLDREFDQFFDESSANEMELRIHALTQCIKGLNKRSQKLLHEFYVKGRLCKDIAREEGIEEKTPVMHLWRLRSKLRNCMEKTSTQEEEPPEHENVLDTFFTRSHTDHKKLTNLLEKSDDGLLCSYIKEWNIFATALNRLLGASEKTKENDESEDLSRNAFEQVSELRAVSFSPAEIRPRKSYIFSALAACFGLAIILWYGIHLTIDKPFAEITSGTATVISGGSPGKQSLLQAGETLAQGDSISIAAGTSCLIRLIREETKLEVSGPSTFSFAEMDSTRGKKLVVQTGDMWVTVAKQVSGTAFEVETGQSLIKVLGTRFRLQASPIKTSIFLESGRLLVKETRNEGEMIITTGQNVNVTNGRLMLGAESGILTNTIYDELRDAKDNMILWYRFDSIEGRTIIDSSSQRTHGTLPEKLDPIASWIEGVSGKALYLGSAQESARVQISNFSRLPIEKQFSLATWLKCDESAIRQQMQQAFLTTCEESVKLGFALSSKEISDTNFELRMKLFDETAEHTVRFGQTLSKNSWNHAAFTFDGGKAQCYINGTRTAIKEIDLSSIVLPEGRSLRIGPHFGPYEFALDDLIILRGVLQPSEVQRIFESVIDVKKRNAAILSLEQTD